MTLRFKIKQKYRQYCKKWETTMIGENVEEREVVCNLVFLLFDPNVNYFLRALSWTSWILLFCLLCWLSSIIMWDIYFSLVSCYVCIFPSIILFFDVFLFCACGTFPGYSLNCYMHVFFVLVMCAFVRGCRWLLPAAILFLPVWGSCRRFVLQG